MSNYLEYRRQLKLKSSSEKLKDRARKDMAKQTPLPKESAKRKAEKPEYEKAKKELVKETNGKCQIKSPVCTGLATETHHLEGREGENFKDKRKLKRTCGPCHRYVHAKGNRQWALANGFLLPRTTTSKLSKFKKENA